MTQGAKAVKSLMWRAHPPKWSYAPTSGIGASQRGGRYNRPGLEALYVAPDQKTAAAEFLQGLIRPYTLVPYEVDLNNIADLTKPAFLKSHNIKASDLSVPWKTISEIEGKQPVTWRIADDLIKKGFDGALYPSQASPGGTCLVLWTWDDKTVVVRDPNLDLPKDQKSWEK